MATGKQLKAAILTGKAGKGRARNTPGWSLGSTPLPTWSAHVAAAERRIDNDRRSNPNRRHAGLERAQLELSVVELQLRSRGLLRDDDDDEGKTCPTSIWIIVGTSNVWLTWKRSIACTTASGEKALMIAFVPTFSSMQYMPQPFARWNIGAAWRYTASRGKPPSASAKSALAIKLPWLNITPFERPVVPPV